jgi:hypothetical protein
MKNRCARAIVLGLFTGFILLSSIAHAQAPASASRRVSKGPEASSGRAEFASHVVRTGRTIGEFGGLEVYENENRDVIVQVGFKNAGRVMIQPQILVEIYDVQGNLMERFEGDATRLYPGMSNRQQVSVSHLPADNFEVLRVVEAGEENSFGAQYTLDLKSADRVALNGKMDDRQP